MPAEQDRLATSSIDDAGPWKQWGPYLSERAWGTVREDYSENGTAWEYFPHDHARSRAYRWGEDGLAAVSDLRQRLCFGVALWNGRDPILKERLFGVTGNEGNHGEDVKECYWYLDSTPTHSWMRWRYHYPQAEFPYNHLVDESKQRTRTDAEYELLDTGVFDDDRYWVVTVDYAKAAPDDLCIRIEITNAGPESATLHVLPTLWFRNTWSWTPGRAVPRLSADAGDVVAEHAILGRWRLAVGAGADGTPAPLLFCDNETNTERLWGLPGPAFPKDGINDFVVSGAPTVNSARTGTKAAAHYVLSVPAGGSAELRLRLAPDTGPIRLSGSWQDAFDKRIAEADEFYNGITPLGTPADDARIMRQAAAGLLWSKQLYYYNVRRWLAGDPSQPAPPPGHTRRNALWHHLDADDIMSMPDAWEYPWFAAWDLGFHAVALAHLDPAFAKLQLILLCREWFMHPNGQMPAYEWAFGDVNPPVHAWAALQVFRIDGGTDREFLARIFHKLLLNFTWWVNRVDAEGNNLFEGGFLGLDNIGPFDRGTPLPDGVVLEQSDATAWMAMYCLDLLEIALELVHVDPAYEDVATKFFEHFAIIASAMNEQGLWDEEEGFYHDALRTPDGTVTRLRVRSLVGLVPLLAVRTIDPDVLAGAPRFVSRARWFVRNRPELAAPVGHIGADGASIDRPWLLALIDPDRLKRVLTRVLDTDEFLSPYGVRSLSRYHHDNPVSVTLGDTTFTVDYEPAESTSGLFGGNSNWRGPVWMPINHLLVDAFRRYDHYLGAGFAVPCPSGSGLPATLAGVAEELRHRLLTLFRRGDDGRRPCFGWVDRLQDDPRWRDQLWFHEYFHGDDGAGLGASHQTGWTALLIDLVRR
jgi:hypothetical protein